MSQYSLLLPSKGIPRNEERLPGGQVGFDMQPSPTKVVSGGQAGLEVFETHAFPSYVVSAGQLGCVLETQDFPS